MQKKKLIFIIAVLAIIFVIQFAFTGKVKEFSSIEEACLDVSNDSNAILDVLEQEGVALIIYKNPTQVLSVKPIFKDDMIWSFSSKKERSHIFKNGFVYEGHHQNKVYLYFVISLPQKYDELNVVDNMESEIIYNVYDVSGQKLLCGLSTLNNPIEQDYQLMVEVDLQEYTVYHR